MPRVYLVWMVFLESKERKASWDFQDSGVFRELQDLQG